MPHLRSIACCVASLIAATSALGEPPADRLTDEDRQLFAWFDQLGIADFRQAKLVRVILPEASVLTSPAGQPMDQPRAFLLSEKEGHFRFLVGDLLPLVLERQERGPSEPRAGSWREVSVEAETQSLITALTVPGQYGSMADGHQTSQDLLGLEGQAFVLARYCLAKNLEDLAATLVRAAEQFFRNTSTFSLESGVKSVIAAYILRSHKQPEALAAMLTELDSAKPELRKPAPPPPQDPNAPPEIPDQAEDPFSVLRFLLTCDSALAIQELRAFLPQCSNDIQREMVIECSSRLTEAPPVPFVEPAGKATRAAMEELFISELRNEATTAKDDQYRIADTAAQALAENWPSKYEFDPANPIEKRTAQIAAIRAKYKPRAKSPEPGAK
jgi:hypothetical protein